MTADWSELKALINYYNNFSIIAICLCCRSSQSKLDYESILLVTRYLASNRPFSQSFDIYLTQVIIDWNHGVSP